MIDDERVIKLIQDRAKNRKPVVLSSFGKDSMVMLDLIKRAGLKFPILFFKEPFFPEKYEFSRKIILENKYSVYDYHPLWVDFKNKGKNFELVNHYQINNEHLYLPTGIVETEDEDKEFLCGLKDIYEKPTGTFEFPWNLVLVGHKSSDIDPILGEVPIKTDYFEQSEIEYLFPLRNFTDEDVWKYTLERKLPIHTLRYNKDNGYKEFEDKTYNPDYFPVCIKCMKGLKTKTVTCPKTRLEVRNVQGSILKDNSVLPAYIGV